MAKRTSISNGILPELPSQVVVIATSATAPLFLLGSADSEPVKGPAV